MSKKNVDDYLTEGMYGVRRPLENERKKFLGTLRERIVIVLTVGEVMTGSGLKELELAMKDNPNNTRLLINGEISYRYSAKEKSLANKYDIPYTVVTQEGQKTNIGAVLTYEYAINKEKIYIKDLTTKAKTEKKPTEKQSFFSRFRNWFH